VNVCFTCGNCCRAYLVPVGGYDIWRICRHQELKPAQFLVAYRIPEDRPNGFLLDANGYKRELALDKRRSPFRLDEPCVFLQEAPTGGVECGIYADRPGACRVYPASPDSTLLREDSLCPPGAWPDGEFAQPAWRMALEQLQSRNDEYREVVERWNTRVKADPTASLTVDDFVAHVLEVYDALAAGE
jgi:Fe-S-cluster containining protein